MGEPVTTGLIIASLAGAATTAYAASRKPKMPSVPKLDRSGGDKAVSDAPLLKQRQKRAAAASDTVLTGPSGVAGAPTTAKTMLGQ